VPEYPAGQGVDQKFNFMIPPEVPVQPIKLGIMGEELIKANKGECFIYLHGFVVYLDFSGKERRTAFCYYYAVRFGFSPDPTRFYLEVTAPPGYNDYT
jgi:hypothetical protein